MRRGGGRAQTGDGHNGNDDERGDDNNYYGFGAGIILIIPYPCSGEDLLGGFHGANTILNNYYKKYNIMYTNRAIGFANAVRFRRVRQRSRTRLELIN